MFEYFDLHALPAMKRPQDLLAAPIDETTHQVDKTGTEIYEGDVLKFHHKYPKGRDGRFDLMVVEWSEKWNLLVYRVIGLDQRHLPFKAHNAWRNDGHSCEVIGTIHQNPELLK